MINGAGNEYRVSEDAFAFELLRRMAVRERQAMEQFYGLFQDAVYRMALVRVEMPSTAALLLQELMLRLWSGLRLTPGQSPRLQLLRLAARAAAELRIAMPEEPDPSTLELLPSIDRHGIAENLHTALRRLPERYRTVVHLAYFEHLSDAEIAEVLGSSEDAVSWTRRQGRDALSGLTRGPAVHDERARDLFLDAWIRRELRMAPDSSPCDFGLDRLKLAMREAEQDRNRRQLHRRFVRRPLAKLLRWLSFCAPARRESIAG